MGREGGEFGDYDSDDDRGDKDKVVAQDGEYDRIRTKGRERSFQLAKHKEPKVEWWTCVGPEQDWGTQSTTWPLSNAAKSAQPTPRLEDLATPKKNFQVGVHSGRPIWQYSCGRSSVIAEVESGAKSAEPTERLKQLAQHKTYGMNTPHRFEFFYSCGRESPLWQVSGGAKNCDQRPHTTDLAQHKKLHRSFEYDKDLPWSVPTTAQHARQRERTEILSVPRYRDGGPFREPGWPVSGAALNSTASPRCMELSRARGLADGYQHAREIQWPVSKAARRTQASGRISELSQPIQRVNMNFLQFNPDAFQVKPLALKGTVSSRVQELAQPISR